MIAKPIIGIKDYLLMVYVLDQKLYLPYYVIMFTKFNHSRAIADGDLGRNISTSSSPDTCGKISALYTVTKFARAIRVRVLGTRTIRNHRKRHFAMQTALRQVINDYFADLPRALSIAEKTLEDQITALKDAYRREPITESKQTGLLESKASTKDN